MDDTNNNNRRRLPRLSRKAIVKTHLSIEKWKVKSEKLKTT